MRALHLLLGVAILISFSFDSAFAGADGPSDGDLLAIERNGLSLHTISPTDGSVISTVTISLTGETIEGGTGLAVDPTTGTLYALLKIDGDSDRVLVTIDPATGVATLVGSVGIGFAGIAFDNTGTLFGVTGDAGSKPIPGEQFFSIDKTTGIPTLLCDLGNGSDGENIVFNPLDAKMYHFSGRGTQVFETIDDTSGVTCGVTNIPLSGDRLDDEPTGMVFSIPDGLFFVSTSGSATFNSLTTGGFATELGDTDDIFKGLAILVPPPLPPGEHVFSIEADDNFLHKINPDTGDTISSVEIILPGERVRGGAGLTFNPEDGKLYALVKIGNEERQLVTIFCIYSKEFTFIISISSSDTKQSIPRFKCQGSHLIIIVFSYIGSHSGNGIDGY